MTWSMRLRPVLGAVALLVVVSSCSGSGPSGPASTAATSGGAPPPTSSPSTESSDGPTHRPPRPVAAQFRHPLPGMPPVLDGDVYGAARVNALAPKVANDPAYLYVPNSYGAPHTTVIDQRTHKIVRVLHTGVLSQHVTPSWDLRTLYVEASGSNQLVAIDPRTARVDRRYNVPRPYNLYFTPDGKQAIVMSEEYNQINFVTPRRFKPIATVTDPSCQGPNHADFSANGRFFVVSCEFSGSLLKVSTLGHRVTGRIWLGSTSMPQDVRLSPDGKVFYVAEMGRNRVLRIGWHRFRVIGHTDTPSMPHGIYPSRDGKQLYVSDRGAGKVSVISVATNKIVDTWSTPPGGSPDMGGISADGKTLWLSGRDSGYVYGWNTHTGRLIAKIYVGGSPHGIAVWPQPGRYSLGHTGNMR